MPRPGCALARIRLRQAANPHLQPFVFANKSGATPAEASGKESVMEFFLFGCVFTVLVVRWLYIRERLQNLEARLLVLERAAWAPAAAAPLYEPVVTAPPPPRPAAPPPSPPPPVEPPPSIAAPPVEQHAPAPPVRAGRSSEEWEALIGGNWTNKLGVFVTVIALALLLKYAYAQLGPAGRVALSLAASFAMLAAGVLFERREEYRTFAYGLIGGGWAALFTTVYAMHAIAAAKVVDNPLTATLLLLAVVAGMIVHSLKYRAETVTGLAYFLAFTTLAISEVTTFSVIMVIPLAASLLFVAHRHGWSRFAIFGLVATYATCGLHKDTGSPLWQTQALFLVYWLVFEAFDLIRSDRWLLPLNALGFLLLSSAKWAHSAPDDIWQLAAGAAALYLGSTIVRIRADRWRPAVLLNAVLATAAIVLKLHEQWVPLALAIDAEIYYLAGVRFRSLYLRRLATAIFLLQAAILLAIDVTTLPAHTWEPVAAVNVTAFYLNRVLVEAEVWYGYAAVTLAALIAGFESSPAWRGPVWSLMAVAPFSLGWWRRLSDFRRQGYALALAGVVATAIYLPYPPLSLAIVAALAYALVHSALWSGSDRFGETERSTLRSAASVATTLAAAALLWRIVPAGYLGIAWLALAVFLLEAGLRDLPAEFRLQACLVVILGAARVAAFDLSSARCLIAAALVYGFAWRGRREAKGRVADVASFAATFFLMAGLLAVLPAWLVSTSWAAAMLLLAEFPRRSLRVQALLVAAAASARCLISDLSAAHAILAIAPVIVCIWGTMLRRPRGTRSRLYYSLLATALLAILIGHEVSGSLLTVAWSLEGIVLLAAGFALPDRVSRLSGLALLLGCILKLFVWDLRNLDTLPRIFSFIVLGLLLVLVSWVYTRFRDQVRRYL
jgi:uncharacterized membrane protein